ncbi:hypothetical protein ElyMa_003786800 [Elysia marginata]|uniref:Uncharacterized protein n=1 Tax=Elysia marginata TaxID=1093978 RepID=A0AAV4FB07_9GAST|nr:hypothetical protein ElyMa_003786800 [Elysia marginata]
MCDSAAQNKRKAVCAVKTDVVRDTALVILPMDLRDKSPEPSMHDLAIWTAEENRPTATDRMREAPNTRYHASRGLGWRQRKGDHRENTFRGCTFTSSLLAP